MDYTSRRSPVFSLKGMCASSQHVVTKLGVDILDKGGNAMDACVAMSAALSVVEPCSTGLGGDAFILYYEYKSKKVHAINGSGRSPKNLSFNEVFDTLGFDFDKHCVRNPVHVNTVTVPGACAAWCDAIEKFGNLSLTEILGPAIRLCDGFPVNEITAQLWSRSERTLLSQEFGKELLIDGHSPQFGEIWKNPSMKKVLTSIAEKGKKEFYEGWIGKEIVSVISSLGGKLDMNDLACHRTDFTDPICTDYKSYRLYEAGPNSQGLCALIALNILENFDLKSLDKAEYLHLLIEAMKLSFSDVRKYITDPDHLDKSIIEWLLSKKYAKDRSSLIDKTKSTDFFGGIPSNSSDTVQFCCVDQFGNACSFVNSNFTGFGSCIVPKGCGFTLQNRGSGFHFDTKHFNVYAPNKRPYHTIM